jgi:SAM-dependent methyltransferase
MDSPAQAVFTRIYRDNMWGGTASISGPGSELPQTRVIAGALPALFQELQISSMLDIPCGDFYWMQHLDLSGLNYTGADIVQELVQKNVEQFESRGLRFRTLNLIEDPLPTADLVFCRDCLVHFSDADVRQALENVCASQSLFLLTTTFPDHAVNQDIATGHWRPLNLEVAPFNLPPPLRLINEEFAEGQGAYADKSMGLWRVADIRAAL